MQTFSWYAHRLRTMSAAEVLWRGRCKVRDLADRGLARGRRNPVRLAARRRTEPLTQGGLILPDLAICEDPDGLPPQFKDWRKALLERADRICRGRLTLFDLEHQEVRPLNWNYEHKARKNTPKELAGEIDYRDYALTGDCKFVWEPNRHQHWVTLARAYRLTGEGRYRSEIKDQMESWIAQCPFGMGMNWRSPLELGIRLINWVWTLELIGLHSLPAERRPEVIGLVYQHLWEIRRKYSRFSSANNHRVGEAAGVFIASHYFRGLGDSGAYREESHRILFEEIQAQTYDDGGTREQAMGYHLFVLELFLLAGIVARRSGEDFAIAYWERLERMCEFLQAMQAGGDELPMFGDCDDGYVLDLGSRGDRARDLLSVAGIVLQRPDFLATAGGYREPSMWLLGSDGYAAYQRLRPTTEPARRRLVSQAFRDSGYYLLQCGQVGAPDRMSVTFDCGELGFGPIAAHGHADALSITLRVAGRDVLVDPGTYDYFTYARWRDYFRSTRAHNTVVVDGRDQSLPLGLFLWGRRARTQQLLWQPAADGGMVAGEHDGYRKLGVCHRRFVRLDGRTGELVIEDELEGAGAHRAEILLHFAEDCVVERADGKRFRVKTGAVELLVEMDAQLDIHMYRGSEHPILGWVSRGYHRKNAATTLAARARWQGRLETRQSVRLVRAGAKEHACTDDAGAGHAVPSVG